MPDCACSMFAVSNNNKVYGNFFMTLSFFKGLFPDDFPDVRLFSGGEPQHIGSCRLSSEVKFRPAFADGAVGDDRACCGGEDGAKRTIGTGVLHADGKLSVGGVGIERDTHPAVERIRCCGLLRSQGIGKAAAVFRIFLKCDVSRNAVAVGIVAEGDGAALLRKTGRSGCQDKKQRKENLEMCFMLHIVIVKRLTGKEIKGGLLHAGMETEGSVPILQQFLTNSKFILKH